MEWLDYREQLGIGFNDIERYKYFLVRVFNVLNSLRDTLYGSIDYSTYMDFHTVAGLEIDPDLLGNGYEQKRYHYCVNVLDRHSSTLSDFLSYYVAFMNSMSDNQTSLSKDDLKNILLKSLNDSHISYDLLEDNGEYFIFPKGIKDFDDALVSNTLVWLSEYPTAEKAWKKALREYAENNPKNASDVADLFRKALETFFKEFFGNDKTLEKNKPVYGSYLKSQGVPSEISNNLETLLLAYTTFMNAYAKHHDKTEKKVLEYLMYQTGNIMRLLITLKAEELSNAD